LDSDFGSEGRDTFPRPAFWSAILVPSLVPRELNMIAGILGDSLLIFGVSWKEEEEEAWWYDDEDYLDLR
jgi:hypothetical protein